MRSEDEGTCFTSFQLREDYVAKGNRRVLSSLFWLLQHSLPSHQNIEEQDRFPACSYTELSIRHARIPK